MHSISYPLTGHPMTSGRLRESLSNGSNAVATNWRTLTEGDSPLGIGHVVVAEVTILWEKSLLMSLCLEEREGQGEEGGGGDRGRREGGGGKGQGEEDRGRREGEGEEGRGRREGEGTGFHGIWRVRSHSEAGEGQTGAERGRGMSAG